MDSRERRELTENMRRLSGSVPRTYVERGVSRRDKTEQRYTESGTDYESKPLSEYRRERQRSEADAGASAASYRENAGNSAGSPYEPYSSYRKPSQADRMTPDSETSRYGENRNNDRGSSSGESRASSGRRFNSRSSRPRRELAPDEEPPLLDTFRDAATRRYREKKDFNERYERSRTGASMVERERDKDGTAVRDVEYFVPKAIGDNAADINYGRKRKSRNRKPMKMWQKASLTTLSLFMVFLMLLGLGVSAMLNRMNFVDSAATKQGGSGGTNTMQLSVNAEADEDAAGLEDVDDSEIELPDAVMFDADIENVLLIGSDRRSMKETGRSDAMMLVTIDRKHKKIKMISFLRDLYIKIPGKYGTKLNSAYSVGGVDLLKQTIEANLGISVDKYIIVDFNAFKTVVNKIGKLNGKGGIKITVTSSEATYMCSHEKYGLFPRFSKGKGTYYMNGAEALNYARIRKIDSDFGRTKRQRKVLTEIITELKDLKTMDLGGIAYSCLEYVTTDFTKGELVGLVTEAAEIMNYETKQISIPIKGSYSVQHMSNGNEVLAANLNVNSKELIKFIYDDDMTYEGNQKEIRNIFLPDLKGIANSNVTTKKTTTSTEAGDVASTTAANGGTTQSTAKGGTTKSTAKKTTTTAKGGTTKSTAKKTTTTAKGGTTKSTAKKTTTTAKKTTTTTSAQAVG